MMYFERSMEILTVDFVQVFIYIYAVMSFVLSVSESELLLVYVILNSD